MNTKEFTKIYYRDRRNTDCIKWDGNIKGTLPMFIADMDFAMPNKATEALVKRINHGSFGYTTLPKDYLDVFTSWHKKRNKVSYKKDTIRYSKGAIDGIYQILYSLTNEKDAVMVMTPAYPPFISSLQNTSRKVVKMPLSCKDNHYYMNYKNIETSIIKNNIKALILCSPHNPIGRVWNKYELKELFTICHKHKVLVISDEVHSDLIMDGYKFIPSLSFKEYQNDIVTITAASKTFSLAAFSHCHIIIPNKKLLAKFDKYQLVTHNNTPIAINALATYYCYKYGEEWLDTLMAVVKENYEYIKKELSPYCVISKVEGTYLVFLKFNKLPKGKTASKFLINDLHIQPNTGESFDPKMTSCARINMATSLTNIKTFCKRVKDYYKNH